MDYDERQEQERQHLIRMGEQVFSAYEAILKNPKADPMEVSGVLSMLFNVKADRSRFLKYVLSRLTDSSSRVRMAAVRLLGRIGASAEASAVVPLLSDENEGVVNYAAETLAAIGVSKELVAMDEWLRGDNRRDFPELREHVQKCRDDLKKRLEEDRDPKKRAEKIQHCWRELQITAAEEEYQVHHAVWNLTAFGTDTVAFLKDHIHPVSTVVQKRLDQLLADLGSDSFDRREAATRELSRGVVAESVLEKALANHPSLEMRRRLESILEDLPNWRAKNPELLRQVRAIWVLQQIGTPEAKALLEKIAAGAPSARLTQKAKDALVSLKKQQEAREK